MSNAVRPTPTLSSGAEAVQMTGLVVDVRGGTCHLDVDGSGLFAARAASCLLEPVVGDRVLVLVTVEQAWVLAVLEREQSLPATLKLEGDLELNCGGTMTFFGKTGVEFKSDQCVSIESPRVNVLSRLLEGVLGRLSLNVHSGDASFGSLKLVGRWFDTVVERFSLRSVNSYRETRELDQTRAGQLDFRASQNVSVRGRNILSKSEELTRMDGDQIHLG